MAAPRKWSDDDRARAQVALQVNSGNVKATVRDTGIPAQTIRDWKKQWAQEGVPAVIESKVQEQAEDYASHAERVRDKALALLEQRIDEKDPKLTGTSLATIFGILTDKVNLAKGLATSRTENVYTGPSPAENAAALAGFFASTVVAVERRAEEIIDADVEQPPGLNP